MLLALMSLGSVFLVSTLRQHEDSQEARSQRNALRALHDARLALIAHGLVEDNTPGTLPSPSGEDRLDGYSTPAGFTGSPGQAARRLPWHFLGLQATLGQECLWYAVSKPYRNSLSTENRDPVSHTAINPNSSGTLALENSSVPLIAAIISPGLSLAQQTRGSSTSHACQSGNVSQFLESSNADNTGIFINASHSSDFNDSVVAITHIQMLKPVIRRVLRLFLEPPVRKEILIRMAGKVGTLDQIRGTEPSRYEPFDAILAQTDETNLEYNNACAGIVTNANGRTTTSYKHPVSWLCFNDWYSHIEYHAPEGESPILAISLAAADYIHRCTLTLDTNSIVCKNINP
ncbi:MAG: hypothetical protein H6R19_3355 [Proteobacteria bacterium]|nr:hypothetical protein [Pseudomonadota bacterium]